MPAPEGTGALVLIVMIGGPSDGERFKAQLNSEGRPPAHWETISAYDQGMVKEHPQHMIRPEEYSRCHFCNRCESWHYVHVGNARGMG